MILFFVRLWYRLTMAWTLWRKPHAPVAPVESPLEIPPRIRDGRDYRPDPRFRDYLAHPQCFQARINAGEDTFDCEDHATYWAVALYKSGLCRKAGLGMVYWKDARGKMQGHVVCVFQDLEERWFWADYHNPVPIESWAPWWIYGLAVVQRYGSTDLRKVVYLEITDVRDDDTPIFRGKHLTQGHWFRKAFWST